MCLSCGALFIFPVKVSSFISYFLSEIKKKAVLPTEEDYGVSNVVLSDSSRVKDESQCTSWKLQFSNTKFVKFQPHRGLFKLIGSNLLMIALARAITIVNMVFSVYWKSLLWGWDMYIFVCTVF